MGRFSHKEVLMKSLKAAVLLGIGTTLISPSAVDAQLWFFPDFALPSSSGPAEVWLGGTYGRGLNDASGEIDTFAGSIGLAQGRASFMGSFGYITEDDGEYTVAGSAAVDLNTGEGARFALQGGIGWMDLGDVTFLRFPIGLALKGNMERDGNRWSPWVMPKVNISRASLDGESETETDLGAAAGISFTSASGLGFHTSLDAWFAENDTVLQLGAGVHFMLGRGN
jgi:hypothetical protein